MPAAIALARERLEGPPFPDVATYLWTWSCELDAARRFDMHGPVALGYQELDAWARLTGRHPEPHEVRALFALDAVLRHPTAGADPEDDA